MATEYRLPDAARRGLRRPLALTRAGMTAERAMRAFWPLWTLLMLVAAALMLGLQDVLPIEAAWLGLVAVAVGIVWAGVRGILAFRMPSETEALDRLDRTLPGRPITAIGDSQAIGGKDAASRAVWEAHVRRMADRVRTARTVRPNLRISDRDPYALRYAALLALVVAILFGSFLRVGSVADLAPGTGSQASAAGPSWEGWIEPPAYTGLPSLYLADLGPRVEVPEGSTVTLRLYGRVGDLAVVEDVSGLAGAQENEEPSLSRTFPVAQPGRIEITGDGGRGWDVTMAPDAPPAIVVDAPAERAAGGEFRQPFRASDDFGVTGGTVSIALDPDAVDRRHGLATAPDPRDPIVVDLPLPISGDRSEFTGMLADNFSEHPWANLPVTFRYEVEDAMGQTGMSEPIRQPLHGLRFFDPMAQAIVEQRRDLLWSRDNARRVAQILRSVSYRPEGVFTSETLYLRLRVAIRRLEAGLDVASLAPERQEEIAQALWDIANQIEYGDMSDALDRLRRAQERLSEAMENGADEAEIAELMQELREAMDDYMRQLAEQSQQQDQQQAQGEMQEISPDQLQEMMDRIQELMEEGRMAEAQALLEQLNRMMENMQVTQGQQGQGQQSPGQQTMEDLQETLRDQQGLSDETFRDLREQFGQNQQPGQQGQQQGQGQQPGQPGQGQQPGQPGQGQGQQPGQSGQGQQPGSQQSLAERQQALRDELERQQGNLPGAGTEAGDAAREALDRAGRAMDGAEEALRDRNYAEALDQQSDAMEALRDGIRNLGEAMAEEQSQQNGEGQATAEGDPQGQQRDPLGREPGSTGRIGSDERLLGQDDVYRRAEELLGEIRRRSGDRTRPEAERDYLERLLDRF